MLGNVASEAVLEAFFDAGRPAENHKLVFHTQPNLTSGKTRTDIASRPPAIRGKVSQLSGGNLQICCPNRGSKRVAKKVSKLLLEGVANVAKPSEGSPKIEVNIDSEISPPMPFWSQFLMPEAGGKSQTCCPYTARSRQRRSRHRRCA